MEGGPRILVVEDEMFILRMVEDALEEGGFEAVIAPNGTQAIQVLNGHQKSFRAIVTDVNLGRGVSGWDVARHAREIDPDIGVIYITGHGAEDWTAHGLPKSVLLTKPFAGAQLVTAVAGLLNGATPSP